MFVALLLAAIADAPAVPPASESAIDAFIAVLPPPRSGPESDDERPWHKNELARLEKANAGREIEVRAAFATFRQCDRSALKKAVNDALRSSARQLGDAKLARMTEFYKSADSGVFQRLSQRTPDELSKAEKAEFERIFAAYPLKDYSDAAEAAARQMWSDDGYAGALLQCQEAFESDLLTRGLKP